MTNKQEIPVLLSNIDLATRWGVTRQVTGNWFKRYSDKFPNPDTVVANGTIPLYLESTIVEFECTDFFKKLIEKNKNRAKNE
ncbi:hypothetical protein [Bacillus sp. Au-Bac7]|uniref:hypothetical protein n=1 Tax=Bacillus sp. Au-Bac7 TaxID=2906458 RepID=UPI001E493931|nr:hypothetical protein [Bacillus sp. Au-Bac7]MCE4051854.1 hypothetical protein [Bacillus sp. Au-Bac7]